MTFPSGSWVRALLGAPMPAGETLSYQRQALIRCMVTVRLFYGLCLYWLARLLARLPHFMQAEGMDPLWPLSWVPFVGEARAALVLFCGATAGAAFLCLFPQSKGVRVAFAVLLTLVGAWTNSFGKINHDWHAAIVIAFFLCFLPGGSEGEIRASFRRTRAYVLACALAIAGFSLCYSISGFWKVSVGFFQLVTGEVHAFHPEALAYHVSRRIAQTQTTPTVFADFLLAHPWSGYLPYLATLYAESFAVFAAFRVRTHRVVGLLLLLFHVGSALTLKIGFPHHQLLLLVMLIGSPLTPAHNPLTQVLLDLPLFGDLARWVQVRKSGGRWRSYRGRPDAQASHLESG